jgi:hypothetical protein
MRNLAFILFVFAAIMVSNNLMGSEKVPVKDKDPVKIERKIIKTIQTSDDGKTLIDSTTTIENGKTTVHVDTIDISNDFPFLYGGMGQMHIMRMGNGNIDQFEMDFGQDDPEIDFDEPQIGFSEFEQGAPDPDQSRNFGQMDEFPQPPMPNMCQQKEHKRIQSTGIDLNDPSIISYVKEEQKDGTEKITIIRKVQKPCCENQKSDEGSKPEMRKE